MQTSPLVFASTRNILVVDNSEINYQVNARGADLADFFCQHPLLLFIEVLLNHLVPHPCLLLNTWCPIPGRPTACMRVHVYVCERKKK